MRRVRIVPMLLLIALTGCTDGDRNEVATAGGPTPGTTSGSDPLATERAFIACMRAEGVEMSDPIPGDTSGRSALRHEIDVNGQGSNPAFMAAVDRCLVHLPAAGEQDPAPPPDRLAQLRQVAQCMRDNGLPDFPDPDPVTGRMIYAGNVKGNLTRIVGYSDEVILADIPENNVVMEKCRHLLPAPRAAASRTPGAGG